MKRFHLIMLGLLGAAVSAPSFAEATATTQREEIANFVKASPEPVDEAEPTISLGSMKEKKSYFDAGGAKKPQQARLTPLPTVRKKSSGFVAHTGPATPDYTSALDMKVSFELNSAILTEQGRAEAQAFADVLKTTDTGSKRFIVAGHTDMLGSSGANFDLSRRRAQSVVDFLVSQGVDRSRLVPAGYGFERPQPGKSAEDPSNRRVEFAHAN